MGRQFKIGNPPIEVGVKQSARARRLSLRVSRLDGRVSLTMPHNATDRQALAFLSEREAWLRQHLGQVAPTQTIQVGGQVLFRGKNLSIAEGDVRRATLRENVLIVPKGAAPVAPKVKAFLKLAARDALAAASDAYAARLGVTYGKLSLRDTRSRWGSCSHKGVLMYSWRLIMAPPEVLSYVAAHEVAHLREMNHSPAFWRNVETIMPDYKTHRAWLRANGTELHRWKFDD